MDGLAALKKRLGVKNLRSANRATNYFYQYPFNFTALATGNSSQILQKVTASAAFVVTQISGVFWDSTKLCRPGYVTADPFNDLLPLTVQWSFNDGQAQANPVPWDSVVGTAQNPFFPVFKPVFPAGANVVVTIANNLGVTVTGSLVFTGYHVSER